MSYFLLLYINTIISFGTYTPRKYFTFNMVISGMGKCVHEKFLTHEQFLTLKLWFMHYYMKECTTIIIMVHGTVFTHAMSKGSKSQ